MHTRLSLSMPHLEPPSFVCEQDGSDRLRLEYWSHRSGLAPMVVEAVMKTVLELKRERVSMLLVEQNAEMALRLADRVYVIDHGAIVFEGTPSALRADPQITTTYLGVGG